MERESIKVIVYGADVRCASCVNAPGSKETYEWLQAAISRKYGEKGITYQYFNIYTEGQDGADEEILQQILTDELFYPLVLVENEIVAEGHPRLKKVYHALEKHGLQQVSNS